MDEKKRIAKIDMDELDNFKQIMSSIGTHLHPPKHQEYMKGFAKGVERIFAGVHEIIEETDGNG